MEKLPEDFKDKWVKALKSRKYKQGKYELYNKETESYCCIGVAGRIRGISLKDLEGKSNPKYDEIYKSCLDLPETIISTLTHMNESGNKSFPQIADWISENL